MPTKCKHEFEHLRLDRVEWDHSDTKQRKFVAHLRCNCGAELTKERSVKYPPLNPPFRMPAVRREAIDDGS